MNILSNLLNPPLLKQVFTPGGQPSITYVQREDLGLEPMLRKAIAMGNSFVSLTGATKAGKTVLCRSVMEPYEYVWIDGGQIKSEEALWNTVCSELRLPCEINTTSGTDKSRNLGGTFSAEAGIPSNTVKFEMTLGGSRLRTFDESRNYKIDSTSSALDHLIANDIALIIDDFHFISDDDRIGIVKSLKGSVFKGLKVILLSTPYRAFEAIKAEPEITGRFKHITVPDWSREHLRLIASSGFKALNVECPESIIDDFSKESEGSPLLMQQFCWNLCYDSQIEQAMVKKQTIDGNFNIQTIYKEVAQDSGFPIYDRLRRGPQTRTERMPRPLMSGGNADIYEAILMAIAATGPTEKLTYDQIRSSLNNILKDKVPQKLEVSNALNHLSSIDAEFNKGARALDWNAEELELVLVDPFFRFYLRWEISRSAAH